MTEPPTFGNLVKADNPRKKAENGLPEKSEKYRRTGHHGIQGTNGFQERREIGVKGSPKPPPNFTRCKSLVKLFLLS